MKKLSFGILIFLVPLIVKSQTIVTQRILDWNNLKYSGFYESLGGTNTPSEATWSWGINIGHTLNANISSQYNYGAQIVFPVVGLNMELPKMYIRSTNVEGRGTWAKVLLDIGDQSIDGKVSFIKDISIQKNIEINHNSMLGRNLSNDFTYDGKPMGHYALRWGDDSKATAWGPSLWQSAYGGMKFFTQGTLRMIIHAGGNVGIGTDNPQHKLDVKGKIRAEEVIIETGWADFVFDKDYKLPSLTEVENHINEHKHLPDIPSEAEVKENGGVGLGEMQVKLLQKIEELTLYVIELKKENQEIKERLETLTDTK